MTVRFAEIVDWDSLRNTVIYGTIAGVGITAAYGSRSSVWIALKRSTRKDGPSKRRSYGVVGLIGVAGPWAASSSG